MQYRKFGNLDWQVSALGFGCMRLPVIGGDDRKIDIPEATRMLRYAIDQGINYVDTAYPYHGGGSERFLGNALKDGYRQKVHLASKLPSWLIGKAADFNLYLNRQLRRLKTDHLDLYLLHGLNSSRWEKLRDLGVIEWAEKAKQEGRILALGFSFHDLPDVFIRIVDEYDQWDFCQIQYNYLDIEHQAGMVGLKYAASRGMGVVIMEPLLGGRLANPPEQVSTVLKSADANRTPADWALQWLWDQAEVSVVLSGMSTFDQVEQNLFSASRSAIGSLGVEQQATIRQARVVFEELSVIPCTKCQYCQPCPNGVLIPQIFELFNAGATADQMWMSQILYHKMAEGTNAANCADCGECEEQCPQDIPISDWMPYLDRVLGGKTRYDGRKTPSVI
jgi:predicted aldo/keto reductase-like oxidoreductase